MIRKAVEQLSAYTPGEQPRGTGVIKLNTNENPYPPSPKVAGAMKNIDPAKLRLYPDPVCTSLRKKIATYHSCGVEQVFVGNGSDEVLALALRAFVERNGSVGYFDPSYSLYPVLAAIEGIRTAPVSLADDFGWTPPSLADTSLFFLTNPNAPTSLLFSKSDVSAFCRSYPGVVLIDEAYVDFAPGHCVDLSLQLPNVLCARSLSKSFSLAGLRIGYAVGSVGLIEALYKIKDSYNVSYLAQELASAAMEDIAWMRANVERIRTTRDRVAGVLTGWGNFVYPSATNFIWVRPAGKPAREIFESLRSRNIFVRYFPGPRTGNHIRITIGTDEQMDAFLAAWREVTG